MKLLKVSGEIKQIRKIYWLVVAGQAKFWGISGSDSTRGLTQKAIAYIIPIFGSTFYPRTPKGHCKAYGDKKAFFEALGS